MESNLERIERGGWTPVCFDEFLMSDECETYNEPNNYTLCLTCQVSHHEDEEHTCAEMVRAAAPDLLEALRGMVDAMDADLSDLQIATLVAKAAIAQATEGAKLPENVDGFIHDWLIFTDNPLGCCIAIHRDVMNPKCAKDADRSSPDPDDEISRFGPGSLNLSMTSIDDLHFDVHHVHTLWDAGYLNDNCSLIFQLTGGAA